ncbi:MAG: cobalamin biosynthesis protein CbiD [Lachnospiraceae bacterium]|nr:cobalamin biosynthesis protein CbiD [Lachnospiraceae bacterium]
MRYGFTTGSCAAAAAKAAAYMLLTGQRKTEIAIETPKGIQYHAKIMDIQCGENEVSCGVEKDGGDDPDVTTGTWIYAKVSHLENVSYEENRSCEENISHGIYRENRGQEIVIDGGAGVGRVTRPGLDQPVGSAAINHVPREMIKKEVLEVCRCVDYQGSLQVEISVPQGEELCRRTFNPRLGIVGGISILGTSGIVEPMSSQALLDTIKIELRQRRELGFDYVAVSPGNYGLDFMRETYGYDLDRSVKCSNFIGETIDMAVELGFCKMLLTGHIGKLIKVAGGIMNTHSKEADCRMELLAAFSIKEQMDSSKVREILDCVTTQEAIPIIEESGKLHQIMDRIAERICYYMEMRSGGKLKTDCILYANGFGELAKSKGAKEWFTLLGQEQGR